MYMCIYTCTLLVKDKYCENPWTKANKLVSKYPLNIEMSPKQTELA